MGKTLSHLFPMGMVLLITACASPKITQLSSDTYQVYVKDTRGVFGDPGVLKDQVLNEAQEFAYMQNKELVPISFVEIPPRPGQFHTLTYKFRLVNPQFSAPQAPSEPEPQPISPVAKVATSPVRGVMHPLEKYSEVAAGYIGTCIGTNYLKANYCPSISAADENICVQRTISLVPSKYQLVYYKALKSQLPNFSADINPGISKGFRKVLAQVGSQDAACAAYNTSLQSMRQDKYNELTTISNDWKRHEN